MHLDYLIQVLGSIRFFGPVGHNSEIGYGQKNRWTNLEKLSLIELLIAAKNIKF